MMKSNGIVWDRYPKEIPMCELSTTASRRAFLSAAGLSMAVAAASLAGCATTKSGTTTTISLDVAKVKAYGLAGINAANTVLSLLSFIPSLAVYTAPIKVVLTAINTDFTAFSTGAGSSVSVVYDDSSVKGVVDSLLTDLNRALTVLDSVLTSATADATIPKDTLAKISTTVSALKTIVSVYGAMIGAVISTAADGKTGMDEATALRTLGVR
jgi:hypothetical protein